MTIYISQVRQYIIIWESLRISLTVSGFKYSKLLTLRYRQTTQRYRKVGSEVSSLEMEESDALSRTRKLVNNWLKQQSILANRITK